jgi:hypothetical protein
VAGAIVVAYDVRLAYETTRTAEDGTWSLEGLAPGSYRLRAVAPAADPRADGFYPESWDYCSSDRVELREDSPREGLDIVLREGARLSGRVLDLDGQPVTGATVGAQGASARTELVQRTATTDAEGRFTLVGLDLDPGGTEPYVLAIASPGKPRQYLGPAYRSSEAELVRVEPGLNDIGDWVLLDGITLSGVVLTPDGPAPEGVVYAYATSQVLDTEISRGEWRAEGLPPGDVLFWAESPGYATTYYPGQDRPTPTRLPAPEEGMELRGADLELPRERAITMRLRGDGVLDDVNVLLYNSDGTVGRGAPVEADGSVRIGGLWPGRYRLLVSGGRGGFVDDWLRESDGSERWIEVEEDTLLEARLPRSAGWSGTVRDETGSPVYGATVAAMSLDSDDARSDTTDAEGAYRTAGLTGGTWNLRASLQSYCDDDPGYTTAWWPDARLEQDAEPWDLTPETLHEGTDFVLHRDDDHDGMGDAWERANGLDPGGDDGALDPDEDGLTNLDEWLLNTEPAAFDAAGKECGCAGAAAPAGSWGWLAGVGLALAVRRRR